VEERGRGGLTDGGQDLADGLRVGEEGDKGEGFLAGGADKGEHLATNAPRRCPRARRAAHRDGREGVVSGAFWSALSGWGDGTSGAAGGRTSRPES